MRYALSSALILMTACAEINTPTPISYPSVCLGDKACERNLDAKTLAEMGFPDAGLAMMCGSRNVREAVGMGCESALLLY